MIVNKFNTTWQIARLNLKGIKNPVAKAQYASAFLCANPSSENHVRVLNWMKMTALGYKSRNEEAFIYFQKQAEVLEGEASLFKEPETDEDLQFVDEETFRRLYKDLVNRGNSFYHGSKRPKDMVVYLEKMREIADMRGIRLVFDPQSVMIIIDDPKPLERKGPETIGEDYNSRFYYGKNSHRIR